jgi:hypothetical protein
MLRKVDLALSIGLGLIAFFLYLSTLAPTLLFADGGEFQFVPYLLGISHPTGYPLYLILGWLWSHLIPLGDVAYRMNLLSAFWGGITVGLLYLVGLLLLAQARLEPLYLRQGVSALAALAFATSHNFWSQAIIAEVYTFNTFFVALTLLLLLLWAEKRDKRTLYLFALAYGLSLTHHRTMALLAPAYLLFIWLTDPQPLRRPRSALPLFLLLLLPQLLYLYIPLRAPATSYIHLHLAPGRELVLYENTPRGFLNHVLGQAYGSRLGLYAPWPEILGGAFRFLEREFLLPGILLGLLGLFRLLKAPKPFLLLFLSYMSIFAFCLLHFRGDIKVFFIPTYLIFALWIALGAGTLAEGARWAFKKRPHLFNGVALLLLAYLPLALLMENYHEVDRSDDLRARHFWEALLAEPIPQGAILATNDRNEMMPLWYLQQVEGVRPDLLGLFPLVVPEYADIGLLLDSLFGLGRPVYLIKEMPGLEIKYELQKVNSLVEILSPAVTGEPAYPRNLLLGDSLELVGYDEEPHSPRPGEELRVTLYWRPRGRLERVYSTYLHLVNQEGLAIAQSDHQPGGAYYPTSLWKEREIIRDEHTLTVTSTARLGIYRLLAGMYDSDSQEPLGEGLAIGMVGLKGAILTSPGEMEHPLGINLGDRVTLLGYDLERREGEITLTLHWQARQEMEEDYTVFIHLLDGGEIVAQGDSQPQGGHYPTSIWDESEVVIDEHHLTTGELSPGEYDLWVGIYLLESMERLPVIDAQGEKTGDGVNLGTIAID